MRVTEPFPVAAIEFNPELFAFDRNLDRALDAIAEAAAAGARLIVLPECALSGYIYRDREQFLPYMDSVPGRATDRIAELTARFDCFVAIGIAERDLDTGLTYNTGALIGPGGYLGRYRKNGLNPSDNQWFVPGDTGYPVFDTELGRIGMVICYDDVYWEPARLLTLKGADLIAYICASDEVLPQAGAPARSNHSTIAAVEQLCAWNGLAMVAADRNDAETNPTTGTTVTFGGASSIWQATGERTAALPSTTADVTAAEPGRILYCTIDPARYDNPQKRTLADRRPELYADLAAFRSPTDPVASTKSHTVRAAALQYRIVPGDTASTIAEAERLLLAETDPGPGPDLVVLPAFSFTGAPSAGRVAESGESVLGRTVQTLGDFAVRFGCHIVGSFVEADGDHRFHTAALVGPDGKNIGTYRQTHPGALSTWADAGTGLPVFDTAIGRIGLLLGEDVRFPEASGMLAVRRADIIAVPTDWDGSYGRWLQDAPGLFAAGYPETTMNLWYAVAKTSQAYTVVANAVGDGAAGSSGIFPITPVEAERPVVGSADTAEAVTAQFTTLGDPDRWLDQRRLIGGRRVDLAVPLVLPHDSAALARWREAPGYDIGAWSSYDQSGSAPRP